MLEDVEEGFAMKAVGESFFKFILKETESVDPSPCSGFLFCFFVRCCVKKTPVFSDGVTGESIRLAGSFC